MPCSASHQCHSFRHRQHFLLPSLYPFNVSEDLLYYITRLDFIPVLLSTQCSRRVTHPTIADTNIAVTWPCASSPATSNFMVQFERLRTRCRRYDIFLEYYSNFRPVTWTIIHFKSLPAQLAGPSRCSTDTMLKQVNPPATKSRLKIPKTKQTKTRRYSDL